jgi:hypothetical protein
MDISDWFQQDEEETYGEYRARLVRLYAKYRPIWKAIRRPIHRQCYGYFGMDANGNRFPKHANSRFRPRPIYNRYTGRTRPANYRRGWDADRREDAHG